MCDDWEAGRISGRRLGIRIGRRLYVLNERNRDKDGGRLESRSDDPHKCKTHTQKKTEQRLLGAWHVYARTYMFMHTLTPSSSPLFLSGLQAINSWNWALANSFIQSLVERQNAHGLWCSPWQKDTGNGGWLPRRLPHPISPVFVCSI